MYIIEKTEYGYHMTFGGKILEDEMAAWVEESVQVLAEQRGKFSVFVDMRTLEPIASESQVQMQKGQRMYKQKGMERSVVILESATLTRQFQRIAKQTGILLWERYIDASLVKDWEKVALDWIKNGVEPQEA
ncbi:MAG: hypothetical protein OEV49_04815 [candidate division Zixibacteria bacterium]|nr:hypothetical protein [candidate division Zixibacteria bacterium]MDH3939069.1 hypothetical protein [candidate division Zixibacteria bacterium]MDH4033602.1 hypothetical protein [candidate division Zixibacteria bacterium]